MIIDRIGISYLCINNLRSDCIFKGVSTDFEEYVQREDYKSIIENPALFWLAYCTSMCESNVKYSEYFSFSKEGNIIYIYGREHILRQQCEIVEHIRTCFLKGFQSNTHFNIAFFNFAARYYLVEEQAGEIWNFDTSVLPADVYHDFTKVAFPKLAELCGAHYSTSNADRLTRYTDLSNTVRNQGYEDIHIKWKREFHSVYPIAPKSIPKQEGIGTAFYDLYQNATACDYKLVAKDNVAINIHRVVLYLNGGLASKKC